jgi:hypothetical protein
VQGAAADLLLGIIHAYPVKERRPLLAVVPGTVALPLGGVQLGEGRLCAADIPSGADESIGDPLEQPRLAEDRPVVREEGQLARNGLTGLLDHQQSGGLQQLGGVRCRREQDVENGRTQLGRVGVPYDLVEVEVVQCLAYLLRRTERESGEGPQHGGAAFRFLVGLPADHELVDDVGWTLARDGGHFGDRSLQRRRTGLAQGGHGIFEQLGVMCPGNRSDRLHGLTVRLK